MKYLILPIKICVFLVMLPLVPIIATIDYYIDTCDVRDWDDYFKDQMLTVFGILAPNYVYKIRLSHHKRRKPIRDK
jgi:hypothetical protein